jgi:hypothetical protein
LAVDLSTLLPLAGGAMTGAITTNSTFDGVDIATRDAVLTSTTTTAGAALPKAGGTMTGNLNLGDTERIQLGESLDLKIYHDGTHSYVKDDGTGNLILRGSADIKLQSAGGEEMVVATMNGAVSLYHDNTTKLATSSSGITVTGTVAATAFSGDGSALSNLPAGGVDGITSASSSGTAINISSTNIIGIGTSGGAGQLNVNSGIANTIAKFISGDDNGFIQIEDNDTTGYVDAQNGWISIGGYAQALHTKNLSINVADGRGVSEFTAKAWVNWNGTGTVAIRDSHNVSSISDHGTGDYTVNFSSALGNSNYSFAVGWEGYQDNDNDNPPCKRKGTSELASGSCRFIVNNFSLGSKRDIITLCAQFFGG